MVARLELVMNMQPTATQQNDRRRLNMLSLPVLFFLWMPLLSEGTSSADETLVVNELIVTLIDSVEVPSAETGIVAELLVHEGHSVTDGQAIARLVIDKRESNSL